MTVEIAGKLVFTCLVAWAAIHDLLTLRIPNRLNLLIFAAFVPVAALTGLSAEALVSHAGAAAALFAICLALALVGQLGGGDVKLISGIGLWLGFGPALLQFLTTGILCSVAFMLAMVLLRIAPVALPARLLSIGWLGEAAYGTTPIRKLEGPYGVPLAIAAAVAIWTQ
ncbi:A24 family peptidase [Aquabacter spiritensis]|uniref:Prepilin peptidase CpaA n=1 Tax=Aquabacter spiritensis TaxID=933073 RepID=A0A4R3M7D2_9HYPH|nr:prepilin peptidase [Aquabacter spiritensis]TCT07507.1 prepilin peptidase CpaA [Aquabacter spiritensis]